jgi:site-specific recombinase XerC
MLFDWLVTGQVVATNPAHSVRGPKHVVKTGKTTVLDAEQARPWKCPASSGCAIGR